MSTKQTGYHRGAQDALAMAEFYDSQANDDHCGETWRAYMRAEAKRKRRDARWYMRMYRADERMKQWFAEHRKVAA